MGLVGDSSASAVATTGLFVLLFTVFLWTRWKKSKGKLPPGPWGLPFFGTLLQLGKNPHLKYCEWAQKYGKIYCMNFLGFPCIVLSDTKLIREAFNDLNLAGRPNLEIMYILQGAQIGVVHSEGSHWNEQRRFTLRHLRDFGYGKNFMENLISDEVNDFLGQLSRVAESGQAFGVNHSFNLAVINSLWYIISGKRYKHGDPELQQIFDDFREFMEELLKSPAALFPRLAKLFPEKSGWNKFEKLLVNVRQMLINAVQEHEKDPPSDAIARDFIDEYLKEIKATDDPKSSFYREAGRKSLIAVCADLFIAGSDTTSMTLSWVILYLCKHPEIQIKVQKELDEVVGKSRQCCLADRANLPYCEATILEVLRKSSIVPTGLFHTALKDIKFQGYDLKKGTCVVANIYGVHHDPEYWTNPDQFDPQRFLSADGRTVKRSENLIAFSTGKRVCVGEHMARDTIFLFMTNIFQKFDLQIAPESSHVTLQPKQGFMLQPEDFKVVLQER